MTNQQKRKAKKELQKEITKQLNEPPVRSVLEEIGNSVTHGVGAGLSIAALILMLLKSNSALSIMASCFYGVALIMMFLMSCLYHAYRCGSKVKRLWRRFDYSSIYLLIGGTFAPLYLIYWGDIKGIVLFCVQWALIITGITFVAIFGPGRFRWVHFTLYFVIGWSAIMFIPGWFMNDRNLLWAILGGGLVYTIGMIPFIKDTKGAHFIWHIFVLIGAICHWFAIYFLVY